LAGSRIKRVDMGKDIENIEHREDKAEVLQEQMNDLNLCKLRRSRRLSKIISIKLRLPL